MTQRAYFNSPFLLGFEHLDRLLERTAKAAGDGYPPYNIEQANDEALRITLAVAGFAPDELNVTVEDRQLVIKGKQSDGADRNFLHRGIAARQFQRSFVLAEGIEVTGAELRNGLLTVELSRPKAEPVIRTVEIRTGDNNSASGVGTRRSGEGGQS
ncbi:MAG: Hsp20 family protein [Alphaproteobacteria bacterium]|nr:Hsp20 family protein [Alphaproteobacteria bacterium]